MNILVVEEVGAAVHSGLKLYEIDAFIPFTKNLFPMSSGVSEEASERTNERSAAHERCEQCGPSQSVSGVSKRANGDANGPLYASILQSFYPPRTVQGCRCRWKGKTGMRGLRKEKVSPMDAPFQISSWPLRSKILMIENSLSSSCFLVYMCTCKDKNDSTNK